MGKKETRNRTFKEKLALALTRRDIIGEKKGTLNDNATKNPIIQARRRSAFYRKAISYYSYDTCVVNVIDLLTIDYVIDLLTMSYNRKNLFKSMF